MGGNELLIVIGGIDFVIVVVMLLLGCFYYSVEDVLCVFGFFVMFVVGVVINF